MKELLSNEPVMVEHVQVPRVLLVDMHASIRFMNWCRDNGKNLDLACQWFAKIEEQINRTALDVSK